MKRKSLAIAIGVCLFSASVGLEALTVSVKPNSGTPSVAPAVGTLSVEPTGGTLFGAAHEYVYDQNVSTNYRVSELDWRFSPIFYYGVNVKLAAPMGLVMMLSAKSGISARSGIMEDSDYQNGVLVNGQEVKTLYSQSDNYTERALLARLRLGYNLPVSSAFVVTPFASLHYMNMKWTARDGYSQYPPASSSQYSYYYNSSGQLVAGNLSAWSASLPEAPLYGPTVTYQQEYLIPAAGFSIRVTPMPPLVVTVSLAYSPFIVAQTVDDHVMRQLTITDTFSRGTYIEPRVNVSYALGDHFSVGLGGAYELITGLVGSSTWQNDGSTSTYPDAQYLAGSGSDLTIPQAGGASFETWDIVLSFRVSI